MSGADSIDSRAGFLEMLGYMRRNGARTILVENASRFARDLAVQLAGHDFLKSLGVALIPATAPDFFTEDTLTAVLVRQVLGAIAQFDKASLVARLKAARDRKIARGIKCGGRKSYAEARPELIALARELARPPGGFAPNRGPSLRKIAAELAARGHTTPRGIPYSPSAVKAMLSSARPRRTA